MDEARKTEVRQWLTKARHDLGSAQRLVEGEPPYLDTAAYHCQQAAEKALKAFLVSQGAAFEKTHDLTSLVAECAALDLSFDAYAATAEDLTPYATAFRYPGDVAEPERAEFELALASARSLVSFVEGKLASCLTP